MEGKTEEIAVRSSTDVAQLDELEKILLSDERPEVVDDPALIQREILERLLAAESDEELETFGAATGWRDLEGVPVEIHGFRWRPSTFEEGANVFFVVQATRLDTGDPIVLTTGSINILGQLTNMAKRGTLVGAKRMLQKGSKTAAGYYPLWLVTPPSSSGS